MTGDLTAALVAAVATAVASGDLPGDGGLGSHPGLASGTWRPVPAESGGGPGSYATTLPFALGRRLAADPARVAAVLAEALRLAPGDAGISDVSVTGGGYLSVAVTPDALARLAVRITEAGPGCARSLALQGVRVSVPRGARLATARDWADAWQRLTTELTGRLAEAAGADVTWTPPGPREAAPGEEQPGKHGPGEPGPGDPGAGKATGGPVAVAIAYAGEDAVRFALSRLASGVPRPPGPDLASRALAAQQLGNPAYAVRYAHAHAHAASALRQAADLGLPGPDTERFQPRLLAHPSERVLLDAMSWLPERVAGAARRRQPHVVAAYLEELAGRYFDWQETCPVMRPGSVPPGMAEPLRAGGPQAGGDLIQARLQLACAAGTVLGTGLRLLGIAAPSRM